MGFHLILISILITSLLFDFLSLDGDTTPLKGFLGVIVIYLAEELNNFELYRVYIT